MPVDEAIRQRVIPRRQGICEKEAKAPVHEHFRPAKPHSLTKLDRVRGYLYAYTKSIGDKFPKLYYVETHSGPGCYRLAESGRVLLGTPLLAVTNEPPFAACRYIEVNDTCADALEARLHHYAPRKLDCKVIRGDCNEVLQEVLDGLDGHSPTLIFMDPGGLELDWPTIKTAARHPRSELLILFPYGMAIQRLQSSRTEPLKQAGITRLYGHERWRKIAKELEAGTVSSWEAKMRFLEMFREQMQALGFRDVIISKEIVSEDGLPLYHLFHASRVPHAAKMGREIFRKGAKTTQATLFGSGPTPPTRATTRPGGPFREARDRRPSGLFGRNHP